MVLNAARAGGTCTMVLPNGALLHCGGSKHLINCGDYELQHWNFDIRISQIQTCRAFTNKENPWYSGSALDCWTTGRAIDPAPGVWFVTKFISFAKVVSGPVYP